MAHKLFLRTTYKLKVERMSRTIHLNSEYDLLKLLKDIAQLLPITWCVYLL